MKVYTADERATMSRQEQDAGFQAGQEHNVADVPPLFRPRHSADDGAHRRRGWPQTTS